MYLNLFIKIMLQISHIVQDQILKCSIPKHIQIQNVIDYLNIDNAELKVLTKYKPVFFCT